MPSSWRLPMRPSWLWSMKTPSGIRFPMCWRMSVHRSVPTARSALWVTVPMSRWWIWSVPRHCSRLNSRMLWTQALSARNWWWLSTATFSGSKLLPTSTTRLTAMLPTLVKPQKKPMVEMKRPVRTLAAILTAQRIRIPLRTPIPPRVQVTNRLPAQLSQTRQVMRRQAAIHPAIPRPTTP